MEQLVLMIVASFVAGAVMFRRSSSPVAALKAESSRLNKMLEQRETERKALVEQRELQSEIEALREQLGIA